MNTRLALLLSLPLATAALLLLGNSARAGDPAAAPAPTTATAHSYTLNSSSSELYVQVFKDPTTLAAGLSHDHVVVATGWTGTVDWDTADVSHCKVSISVPVSKLVNDETSMRQKVGYTTTLDDGQRAEVKGHMMDASQLNASSFASITFNSTGCVASGDKVNVTGNLSIHGVQKSVTVAMKVTATATDFSASTLFNMSHTDFGISPFSALAGSLKNKNEMTFVVKAKGTVK